MRIEARASPVGSGTGLGAGGSRGDLHWGYFGPVTAFGTTRRPFGSPHLTWILQGGQPQPPRGPQLQHRGQSGMDTAVVSQNPMLRLEHHLVCPRHRCRGLHRLLHRTGYWISHGRKKHARALSGLGSSNGNHFAASSTGYVVPSRLLHSIIYRAARYSCT